MKLLDALKIVNAPRLESAPPFPVALCCGFTPLHFETFLKAHLSLIHSGKAVHITTGLFGDLAGNIERLDASKFSYVVIAIEWPDLDPRLGLRSAGGWHPNALEEISATAQSQIDRVASAIRRLAPTPVVVLMPTLPVPPISYVNPNRLSSFEAELIFLIARFAEELTAADVTFVNPQTIDRQSPPKTRFDVKNELASGFPYTLEHAEALARIVAATISNRARKKGLITDLDDTLWSGILGEIGTAAVCWSLEEHAQVHGIYQQFLASLAASGTLIAVASKNDPELVEEAFQRKDLLLPKERIFPFELHWQEKSQSVARILKAWNIAPDSVVFVDDSPMELAEVQTVFPELKCCLFPKDDPAKLWDLLFELRDDFGTAQLTQEDSFRTASLRSRAEFESHATVDPTDSEQFLRSAEASITLSFAKSHDPRAFELINKTNQFNLNGVRLTEAEWNALLSDPSRFVLKIAYQDRFGPLGTIAVMAGTANNGHISIDHWVMSCRAFSRRIEHQSLKWIFNYFQSECVELNFASTPRNGPTREFLSHFFDPLPASPPELSHTTFDQKCPALYHSVQTL